MSADFDNTQRKLLNGKTTANVFHYPSLDRRCVSYLSEYFSLLGLLFHAEEAVPT